MHRLMILTRSELPRATPDADWQRACLVRLKLRIMWLHVDGGTCHVVEAVMQDEDQAHSLALSYCLRDRAMGALETLEHVNHSEHRQRQI
jgi:hypothetical protein